MPSFIKWYSPQHFLERSMTVWRFLTWQMPFKSPHPHGETSCSQVFMNLNENLSNHRPNKQRPTRHKWFSKHVCMFSQLFLCFANLFWSITSIISFKQPSLPLLAQNQGAEVISRVVSASSPLPPALTTWKRCKAGTVPRCKTWRCHALLGWKNTTTPL